MPLIVKTLESELKGIFANDNLSQIAATKTAQAITNYWSAGQSSFLGTIQVTAALPLIQIGLISAWSQPQPDINSAASAIADAIDAGILALIIAGGLHGVGGISTTFKPLLITGLLSAMALPPSRDLFATQFAQAIDIFSKSSITFGSGVPPLFVPPIGPLI